MITITLKGSDPSLLLAQIDDLGAATNRFEDCVIRWLRDRDYAVSKNGRWEKPGLLAARLGISIKHLCRRRKHPRCPEHAAETGPCGRVLAISSNPAFEAFLLANKPNAK